jgi:ABC-2 type transport system permease protein
VFAGLFAGVYVYSPGPLLTVLSYVPFTAPLTMPRRLLIGDAAWWEAVLSAGIMLVTAAALVALAARIYQRALLRTGSRTTWTTALGLGRR